MKRDVVVIGAGAAGMMAAIEAGKRKRSVLILEHSEKIGKKIRISGGGRCNFTNLHTTAEHFISQNPHFCKSALAGFTPNEFVALIEKYGVSYHEKKSGQLFCDKNSEEIILLLEEECRKVRVEVKVNCEIRTVAKVGNSFMIQTDQGAFESSSLVVASGGLSIPKLGASPFAYEIARQFGLNVVPCRPGLVPLLWTGQDLEIYGELAGISMDVVATYGGRNFREAVLFTHRGLSGPAILQISNYWVEKKPIFLDLLPGIEILDELVDGRNKGKGLPSLLAQYLPRRFVLKWCAENAPTQVLGHLSNKDLKILSDRLHAWIVTPEGTEGYGKAEVTAGGVDTRELSSKTMESFKVPGVFFVGEAVDVTGLLGGFNFQWAWSSGFAAGQAVY